MTKKNLKRLLNRLTKIKIFDPACGSGNFLIIAYKELRVLEMKILKRLETITRQKEYPWSRISLSQFYGIEIDDFAHEVAILSLWIAEHQLNVDFLAKFGRKVPPLPLKKGGNIICGNAARLDWNKICPNNKKSEIYLLGNPPYLGARNQSKDQKKDLEIALEKIKYSNNLDYVSCWFYKAAKYIVGTKSKFAFVSTNSICQGSQVSLLWPYILELKLEIDFARQSFKWKNNAKRNAGITCVIIGLRNIEKSKKSIYQDNFHTTASNINPYLVDAENIIITPRNKPISELPEMTFGSMPNDGGHLLLEHDEFKKLRFSSPESTKFIKKAVGAREYLNGTKRYCIWITEKNLTEAKNIPGIKNRIRKVKKYRLDSKRQSTRDLASVPYRFGEIRHKNGTAIVLPRVTSEKREYIPFGFADGKSVILDSAQAIYNTDPYVFGIISSKMHMTWVKAVAGRLKTDYRYSSSLCYNTFPFPNISEKQQAYINTYVHKVIAERQKYTEKHC